MRLPIAALFCAITFTTAFAQSADPLPSWNEGKTKQSITAFVEKVTTAGSPDFVPPAERIATFDNDGTLWVEQPLYFQLQFGLDRVKELAPAHPEWKEKEPFKSVLAGDLKAAFAGGSRALIEILAAGSSGMTTEEFDQHRQGLDHHREAPQDRAPVLGDDLPADARVARLSSGQRIQDVHRFRRRERLHARLCGARVRHPARTGYRQHGQAAVRHARRQAGLIKLPALDFFDDKEGKPIAIQRHIGRRPIAAFGNSDGDLQMLQWTCAGTGTRFCLFVRHTDAEREWDYDVTPLGRFEKGLVEANAKGWTIVDMKKDWKVIYPFEKK